jgi:hypothetical protein
MINNGCFCKLANATRDATDASESADSRRWRSVQLEPKYCRNANVNVAVQMAAKWCRQVVVE